MKLYSQNEYYKLYQGNMLDMLEAIDPESIDSIVTDPPYELNFMGKGWDNGGVSFQSDTWKKCYEVLKPGGYLLAFGGSRTFHRIACAIEDAGFEIRDTIMWLYGSGFPKSMNIGLALDKKLKSTNLWKGWGTALKPAYEPIIVARKPFKGSCVDNVLKYGVGGINIDECRVELESASPNGRFPANVVLTYDETDFDEVCGGFPIGGKNGSITNSNLKNSLGNNGIYHKYSEKQPVWNAYNDSGSASRYFYCAKASKKDRDEGLDGFEEKKTGELQGGRKEGSAGSIMQNADGTSRVNPYAGTGAPKKNIHPTVKPTSLMQYLVRLVTPNGGTVLDPFNGSGSTGKAVMYENAERNKGYKYIGIELTEEYLPIAKARIENINVQSKKEQEYALFEI